eukprot:TRINITY_DN97_c0_g1_i1.p1 TRINITY_DN97_c0_g1~~TRINITY_DN97_c0_g1_i1.p1  ORF type:complete len:773 (-),score=193.55 TRINITY_DN97_c0_g1_i1:35-2353(-)
MERLIPVINKLQDVFNAVGTEGIDLPQIVVVGSQSSGKSSVLENIVGRDFLPRGSGIVTRRPLILQLINLPMPEVKDSSLEEWGEFLHCPNEPFYDFAQIKEEIQRETDRTTGNNKGISPEPISLKIYSPHVLNLSLVDLPGITRVPIGDQPSDIEQQIRNMVLTFIRPQNAIIVAVTAANTDLANSDALQLAREVDPDCKRTVGVITKIDLMDKGTNAMDVLLGRVIPLQLGFVGVINRSQQDIFEAKSIRDSLQSERSFFLNHPVYKKIAQRCGTAYLAQTLNKVLLNHIHTSLPELRTKITTLLADSERELSSYGDPFLDQHTNKGALLLSVITKFSNDFAASIEGRLTSENARELYGGARINYIFTEIFGQHLLKMNPLDGLRLQDLRTAIRNATGPRTALFVPESSFELLTKRQISRLHEPSLQCVDAVFDELQRIVSQLESKELLRYHLLREAIEGVVKELLQQCRDPARTMISNLLQMELAYINTSHPDFIGAEGSLQNIVERIQEDQSEQERQKFEAQLLEKQKLEAQERERAHAASAPAPHGPVHGGHGGHGATGALPPQKPPAVHVPTPTLPQGLGPHGAYGAAQRGDGPPARSLPAPPPVSSKPPPQPTSKPPPPPGNVDWASVYGGMSRNSNMKRSKTRTHKGTASLDNVPISITPKGALSEKEEIETYLIQSLIQSYFNIVRKNIQDTIPKAIMHLLVNKAKKMVHNRLVEKLYREEKLDELLSETPEVASRRAATKTMVAMLKKAQEILNEVRDYSLK